MPFKSKKQWKFAFATKQPWAKRWAKHTKRSFKRLPTKAKRRTRRKKK